MKKHPFEESILDMPVEGLAAEVWQKTEDGSYELTENAQQAVHRIIDFVQQKYDFPELSVYIIGSITSNSYLPDTDIDLHFSTPDYTFENEDETDEVGWEMKQYVENNLPERERFIAGHPIEVFLEPNPFKNMTSVGCYDVINGKWEVGPQILSLDNDPLAEYYGRCEKLTRDILDEVRQAIMKAYEAATLISQTKDERFKRERYEEFLKCAKKCGEMFDRIKAIRSSFNQRVKSKDDALKIRSDKKKLVADASFKLLAKFKYIGLLKLMRDVAEQQPADIETAVDGFMQSFAQLSNDNMQDLDESVGSAISQAALAFALSFPCILPASAANQAKREQKSVAVRRDMTYFSNAFTGIDLAKKIGSFTFFQAANILACTYYGEGRGEIKSGGLDLIIDTTINRANNQTNDVPLVCIAKVQNSQYFQYSYWNKHTSELSRIRAGECLVPAEIKTNTIERLAWNDCLKKSVDVLTGKHVVQDKKINSYYVTKMKDPPSWTKQLTNVKTRGLHTFGYLQSNDPKYVDMTTMMPKKSNNIYVVRRGDTLSKIAGRFNTTAAELAKINKLKNPNAISVGQKLKIKA